MLYCEAKRVIRFQEQGQKGYEWVKPFICNETNAKMIMHVTGQKYMEDCIGKKIKIYSTRTKVKGEMVDCLRIKDCTQEELTPKLISKDQAINIRDLLPEAKLTEAKFCESMQIASIDDLPESKYKNVVKRLEAIPNENN